jgi:hypothetical protein
MNKGERNGKKNNSIQINKEKCQQNHRNKQICVNINVNGLNSSIKRCIPDAKTGQGHKNKRKLWPIFLMNIKLRLL